MPYELRLPIASWSSLGSSSRMNEIINLRRARKRLVGQKDARQSEENRRLYGRSKGEKQAGTLLRLQRDKVLDAAKIEQMMKNSSSGRSTT